MLKILDENDRRGVVDNVLEAFFALAQRLFRPISLEVLRVQRIVDSLKVFNCSVQLA
jgi:hypothetical protein